MDKEIIDLTLTPPPPAYINLGASDVPAASTSTLTPVASSSVAPDTQRKRSRRKKRKRTLTEGESQTTSAAQTREPSVEDGELDAGKLGERPPSSSPDKQTETSQRRKERRLNDQTQHRRSPSPYQKSASLKDVDDLFFIDIAPAPLPPAALFASSSTAPAQEEEANNALLLPAHVSVFGNEPVEIMAPTTLDSDDEGYINYLDYDDRANECPTLWRLYEYLSDAAKKHVLGTRKQKQHLSLGEGGEGYIADDEWCYNCGSCGHWGDDCQDVPHREDAPNEFSAFSEHNTLSGPFFDALGDRPEKKQSRKPRDWETGNDLPPTWGNVPDNVGKQGRRNNAAKLRRKAQEEAAQDDHDDWFGNIANPLRGLNGNLASSAPKKITFGKSIQESSRHFPPPPPPPTLLDRLSNSYGDNGMTRELYVNTTVILIHDGNGMTGDKAVIEAATVIVTATGVDEMTQGLVTKAGIPGDCV
ncbi:hypothetical protein DXG03_002885 [Asterophora parasitica]|uniref:CCHC-type domain-containing protein n=1 Tax=Asterophora parasitica TaxID=117018 RepID=A0A9P7GG95_9AGAR|nr:hypothetical protein DXG03_002885 [Asterophora parasitica]